MKKIVIAFAGRKGHGKDYCANLVKQLVKAKATRVSFADPIKELAEREFDWDGRKDAKGRKFLQLLGTEVGRCYNDRKWLDKALSMIRRRDFVINTDLRFNLEVNGLKELDESKFRVIFIHVEKTKGLGMKLDKLKWKLRCFFGLEHVSERGVDCDFHHKIINDFNDPSATLEQIIQILEKEMISYDC